MIATYREIVPKPEVKIPDVDLDSLHPLLPEIIENQATMNIGTVGHVAHGKTTLVKAVSEVHTIRFRSELERNITIKLGYANAKIYKCDNPDHPSPENYESHMSSHINEYPCKREGCGGKFKLSKHISFVDCPGHDSLMATMLGGARIMDSALLLIAGNETCPQPQTEEHLTALSVMKIQNILIAQNKLDLIPEERARAHHESIKNFVAATCANFAPIIPISAMEKLNVDALCMFIDTTLPVPQQDYKAPPKFIVIRSFNANQPGSSIEDLKGGVVGGSLIQGVLKLGDKIEIMPGIVGVDEKGQKVCRPILATVTSLQAEKQQLKYAVPGGLIGVGTDMDPSLCIGDRLVGHYLGLKGQLPQICVQLSISPKLMPKIMAGKGSGPNQQSVPKTKVKPLQVKENLMLNIGSSSIGCSVLAVTTSTENSTSIAKIALKHPVCTSVKENCAISRKYENTWRLIGHAEVLDVTTIQPKYD